MVQMLRDRPGNRRGGVCLSLGLLLLLAACGSDAAHPPDASAIPDASVADAAPSTGDGPHYNCTDMAVGDPSLPMEVVIVATDGVSQMVSDLPAGGACPLEPPPQGGYVMYVAARVRNLNPCRDLIGGVQFIGTLKMNDNIVAFDSRPVHVIVSDDGWVYPDPSQPANFANVNACPDYQTMDIQGQTLTLEVEVIDAISRHGHASIPVVPTCPNDGTHANCVCTCSANYYLGKCN